MTAEALWLHGLGVQRHDSMYLFLPVCMVFLFWLLLGCNTGRWKDGRDLSLLVYLLHPGCIVAVRGLARLTGSWALLVENSLGHFAAVLALSLAAAWLLARLRPLRPRPDARAWRELDAGALRHNAKILQGGRRTRLPADGGGQGRRLRPRRQTGLPHFAESRRMCGITPSPA